MSYKITNELQELLKANVVTKETAKKIQQYFDEKQEGNQNKLSSVFGILRAILVGLGIILVFVQNCDTLPRVTKTLLSFLPLLIGQLFYRYSLLKKTKSSAWSESSAVT